MAIEAARAVYVEESVNRYVVALLAHTRASPKLALGASPRAGIAVLRMAKARAVVSGRDYVLPEDVQAVAEPVLVAPADRRPRGPRSGGRRRRRGAGGPRAHSGAR